MRVTKRRKVQGTALRPRAQRPRDVRSVSRADITLRSGVMRFARRATAAADRRPETRRSIGPGAARNRGALRNSHRRLRRHAARNTQAARRTEACWAGSPRRNFQAFNQCNISSGNKCARSGLFLTASKPRDTDETGKADFGCFHADDHQFGDVGPATTDGNSHHNRSAQWDYRH